MSSNKVDKNEQKNLDQKNNINVNTNMYTFACIRMYKITHFLSLNDSLNDKILPRL